MANKSFGTKQLDLTGASGSPIITSPSDLSINATTVAISTNISVGGYFSSNVNVGTGYSIGIGTTIPVAELEVKGDIGLSGSIVPTGNIFAVKTSGSERLRIESDGRIDVGGNEDGYKFNIIDESNRTTTAETQLLLYAKHDGTGNTGVGFGGGIKFWGDRNGDNAEQTMGNIMCVADVNSGTTLSGALTFETAAAGVANERLRINSDGDLVTSTTVPANPPYTGSASSVIGGGIYSRVINMGNILASNGDSVDVTKDFFTFNCENGAIAGTIYLSVNGNHISTSGVYQFAAQVGSVDLFNSAAKLTYGTYNVSLSIVTSGSGNEVHTIRVNNTYTKNNESTDVVTGGPRRPDVCVTVVLANANKDIVVTRPTNE